MRRQRTGFTLLELMIVLAIGVVLLALAVPAVGPRLAHHRLQAVVRTLAADLGQARHEAARRGQTMHLVFRSGPAWCYAMALSSAADCRLDPAPGNAVLKAVRSADNPGVQLLAAQPFVLSPQGPNGLQARPTDALAAGVSHARFGLADGEVLQVQLTPLGRASICSVVGVQADAPPCPAEPAP